MNREVIHEGLAFGECPRWHEGRLWLSDIFAKQVLAIDPLGRAEVVCEVENHPGGLGWLPDGRLLVVSMADRRLLRLDPGGLTVHADLADACPGNCNDMVVDASGNAYVGNVGYPYARRGQPVPMRTATSLALVTPTGRVARQPGTLLMPNGAAIAADGETLVVAQSHGARLTAYSIATDGSLHDERLFAALPAGRDNPDGICIDAEDSIWVADPHHQCCFRVRQGGQITDVIDTDPMECVACALGGPQRQTLFLVLVPAREDAAGEEFVIGGPPPKSRRSRVEALEVAVPGAGWP